jgi:hypothetical protein
MELLNRTHFETIDFNIYVMKLICMQNYTIIRAMDFWNWKSRYVTLATIKWMDFGLVLWWTSKIFKELIFIFKCNNKIKLEMVWYISNEFYDLWTLIWWKTSTFFQKSISSLKKPWFILKFCKYVLINELYKNKNFNGKKSLGINALLLPDYKKHFRAQKNTKEMDFQICKFLPFLVHPTMHLPLW